MINFIDLQAKRQWYINVYSRYTFTNQVTIYSKRCRKQLLVAI